MVSDYSKFKDLDSSDSLSDPHPNIDTKEWKKMRERQKQERKQQLHKELQILERKKFKTAEELQRINKITIELKPKFVEVEVSTHIAENEEDYFEPLLFLMTHNSLQDFISFIEVNSFDLCKFEEFCLFNLSENIKDNNIEESKLLCKIALYFRYTIRSGKSFIKKLNSALNDEKVYAEFEKEVDSFYLKSKECILNVKKE
ncbi:hypothetical protein H312_02276 [Anncaliia algerae PRA339]|uniref:Cdc37 N-terminal domain-containing protein n=1 Tax=Anncaliia algerae PRA339 TaxID=1288291 RepID=A0A059EZ24_9MICR|nr:hypothetical protein H312_02276 [Anncaliia algerae PRA339]